MQELFFRLGGLRWDSCVLNVIIFVSEKSITFKKRTYRRKTDKKNLNYLISHRHCVIYSLYCLNISK